MSRGLKFAVVGSLGVALGVVGCGGSSTAPLMTPQQMQEAKQQETAGDRKVLEDLEKKYGKDHPQVKQMRMELGLDPFPGAEGQPK